jgi:hypothetical protein
MAGVRGLERLAILAAAVLVAACGSSGTASHTPPPVLATAQATSTALPTAPATQAQAWPGGSLPPGVTVVDEANVIQRLDWSPDGKLLAVMTSGGTTGTGFRVDVLDLAGQKVASFDAFDMAWVDDTHIMTLAASADDPDQETATVYSIDGTESSVVPGAFDGILGNGHGSVALMAPVAASEATAKESFQVWSNGQLGPRIAGYGYPWVWSPDGRLLALSRVTSNGGAATGVGGPIPGILSVLELPEKTVVLSRRYGDIRGLDVYFSPDGTRLATSDGVVLDLADARSMQLTGQLDCLWVTGRLGPGPAGVALDAGRDRRDPQSLRVGRLRPERGRRRHAASRQPEPGQPISANHCGRPPRRFLRVDPAEFQRPGDNVVVDRHLLHLIGHCQCPGRRRPSAADRAAGQLIYLRPYRIGQRTGVKQTRAAAEPAPRCSAPSPV